MSQESLSSFECRATEYRTYREGIGQVSAEPCKPCGSSSVVSLRIFSSRHGSAISHRNRSGSHTALLQPLSTSCARDPCLSSPVLGLLSCRCGVRSHKRARTPLQVDKRYPRQQSSLAEGARCAVTCCNRVHLVMYFEAEYVAPSGSSSLRVYGRAREPSSTGAYLLSPFQWRQPISAHNQMPPLSLPTYWE